MLSVKKCRYLGFLLAVLASTVMVNQATAGIEIGLPVKASAEPIAEADQTALASDNLKKMREGVALDTIKSQTPLTFDAVTNEQTSTRLPMQNEMELAIESMMKLDIKRQVMTSLSSSTNEDGAVFLFAPDFVKELLFPPPPPE